MYGGCRVPGQRERAFDKLAWAGNIERGRKQIEGRYFARIHELRDTEQTDCRRLVAGASGGRIGERAVGGSEIDPNDELSATGA